MTPSFRLDRLTGTWRLVAPARAGVPLPKSRLVDPGLPVSTGRCPFCPGNEEDAGSTLARFPAEGAWDVRAVRNKYPAVGEHEHEHETHESDVHDAHAHPTLEHEHEHTRPALGAHEVIVEGRDHDGDFVDYSPSRLRLVLRAYRDRVAHHEAHGAACVLLFRNRGVRAGSSQAHPHAQIVASSHVPTQVERRAELARDHFDTRGEVLLDAERAAAHRAGRVVEVTEHATLLCPHAPSSPFETWLVPHRHVPFALLDDATLDAVGALLQRGAAQVLQTSARAAWNLVFHLPPVAARAHPSAFWLAAILPRGGPGAGLELASGTTVVSIAPEDAAARLRA